MNKEQSAKCTCHPRSWIFLLGEILFGETGHTAECDLIVEKYKQLIDHTNTL